MIAIYARVSTEEQAKKGYSLKDQIRECRKVAGEGSEIREYIDEGISGEILDRPALSKLRMDIREGLVSTVVCLDPDRLSRKLMNQLIISEEIEKKARLLFVNGEYQNTPEGRLFYQMRGAISEFEKAKINERFCRGRKEKARQGKVVRDYKIYGYDYDEKVQQLVINPGEAEVVRWIFRLFTGSEGADLGINGIARMLTERGVATKRGAKVWHRQVVRQILLNETYTGRFYQNKWNTEGMLINKFKNSNERIAVRERPEGEWIMVACPAIIDAGIFNHAASLMEESRRRWAGRSIHDYLLGGLVRCGRCGNTMTGRHSKNWGKYIYEYTDIKSRPGARNPGCGMRIKEEELDAAVWEAVLEWMKGIEPSQYRHEETEASEDDVELTRVVERVEEIGRKRRNLVNFLADSGEAAAAEICSKLKQLQAEEERVRERQEELMRAISYARQPQHGRSMEEDAWDYYMYKAQHEFKVEDRRALLRMVVREIKVYEHSVEIYGF